MQATLEANDENVGIEKGYENRTRGSNKYSLDIIISYKKIIMKMRQNNKLERRS